MVDITYVYLESLGSQDDVYDFSLMSVDNCTPANGFNFDSPVANSNCADILRDGNKRGSLILFPPLLSSGHDLMIPGNNQGCGGQITAGCLTYSAKTRY